MHDLSQLWVEASHAALSLVEEPRVRARWSEPSSLPLMPVGSLAGHLLHSGVLMVEEAFAIPEVPTVGPFSAARMLAWVPLDDASPVHDGVRAFSHSEAVEGCEQLVKRVRASLKRSEASLSTALPDTILAFPMTPGQEAAAVDGAARPHLSMSVFEFLRSRLLELVVHGDDLAHSVGIEELPFEREVIDLVCHTGIDINIERYGSAAVLRSLFRRDRNSLNALRTF